MLRNLGVHARWGRACRIVVSCQNCAQEMWSCRQCTSLTTIPSRLASGPLSNPTSSTLRRCSQFADPLIWHGAGCDDIVAESMDSQAGWVTWDMQVQDLQGMMALTNVGATTVFRAPSLESRAQANCVLSQIGFRGVQAHLAYPVRRDISNSTTNAACAHARASISIDEGRHA